MRAASVSYTHLDVYKRQGFQRIRDGSRGNAAVVLHHVVRAVQVPQRLVDGDALILQRLLEGGSLGGVDGAGARAAVHQVDGAVAEEADLGAAGQRQRSVVVLQQGSALGLDLCAERFLVSAALLIRGKIALEVLGLSLIHIYPRHFPARLRQDIRRQGAGEKTASRCLSRQGHPDRPVEADLQGCRAAL